MREDESTVDAAASDSAEPSGTWAANGHAAPEAAVVDDSTAAPADDDGSAFLADLARAMQTTAGAEHGRVTDETDRRRQAHVEGIRAREAAESEQLSALAEGDIKGIDSWADAEIARIQRERERRILARRRDLETSVEDHRARVGREVDAVEAAIVGYRAEVDSYFARLEAETDPIAIASQAGSRPTFPDLGSIGAEGGSAVAGTQVIATADGGEGAGEDPGPSSQAEADSADAAAGAPDAAVMPEGDASPDPSASSTDAEAPGEPLVEASADAATDDPDPSSAEAAGQGSGVMPRSSAALLQAVPSRRPMASWFRRDGDQADQPDPASGDSTPD